jgi:hypothetical protein
VQEPITFQRAEEFKITFNTRCEHPSLCNLGLEHPYRRGQSFLLTSAFQDLQGMMAAL